LRGKPVVVGGDPHSRGVVSTCSYEARRYGIHSAMPSAQAHLLCPSAVFIRPHFDRYEEASRAIRSIMRENAEVVEPLSLDEAFLDVGERDGLQTARALKRTIQQEIGLTASVGVSFNKFLAKLASDWDKPDGLTIIDASQAEEFLRPLPVGRLWGVGPKTQQMLASMGIKTCADLQQAGGERLAARLGQQRAFELLRLTYGVDRRPVEEPGRAKSFGQETTFGSDVNAEPELTQWLDRFASRLSRRLEEGGILARTVTIKIRFADFRTVTRSETLLRPTDSPAIISAGARGLLASLDLQGSPVRLVGLQVTNLLYGDTPTQMAFPFHSSSQDISYLG